MSTFRLASINVHYFRKPSSYDSNVSDLVSIIEPLNLDLFAAEEIQDDAHWRQFFQRLSLPYFINGECEKHYFGVGIASRYPISSHSNRLTRSSYQGGRRSLLKCRLDGDHQFLKDRKFAVTHLDHLNEDDRLHQIKEFNPSEKNIDILMGDMNASTREDYTDDYYQSNIVEVRENSQWEASRFDLTNFIKTKWNYVDAFRSINSILTNEQVVTCEYGTRIDYIYLRPRKNDPWVLTKCSIVDTKGATDHNAVFAEFKHT